MFFRHIDQPWSSINTKYYHLWKCHNLWNTITKIEFLSKNSILTKPQHFHEFFPQIFWQFFSWNQSCQQLKRPNPQHFHEFFTPKKKNRHFFRDIKVESLDEDFEQCDLGFINFWLTVVSNWRGLSWLWSTGWQPMISWNLESCTRFLWWDMHNVSFVFKVYVT